MFVFCGLLPERMRIPFAALREDERSPTDVITIEFDGEDGRPKF
jgi:hypothetical protein